MIFDGRSELMDSLDIWREVSLIEWGCLPLLLTLELYLIELTFHLMRCNLLLLRRSILLKHLLVFLKVSAKISELALNRWLTLFFIFHGRLLNWLFSLWRELCSQFSILSLIWESSQTNWLVCRWIQIVIRSHDITHLRWLLKIYCAHVLPWWDGSYLWCIQWTILTLIELWLTHQTILMIIEIGLLYIHF